MNGLTCNRKSSGKYERWEKKVNVLCIDDRNHERYVVVLDHFRNFKGIQLIVDQNIKNKEGILIQGKGNQCSKLKKGKLETKKVVKNYLVYQMNKGPQYNQQSKSEIKKISIYQNMESGCHSVYI